MVQHPITVYNDIVPKIVISACFSTSVNGGFALVGKVCCCHVSWNQNKIPGKCLKLFCKSFFLMRWYRKSAGKDTPIKQKVEKRANSCHFARWITGKHQMMFLTCPNIAAMGCKCVCGERILERKIYFKMLCVIYKKAWKCKNTRWINS